MHNQYAPMQMVGKMIGNMHARKLSETHSYTQHSNPHMVFNNKHYWPYTKYKKNIYLNYK